jgi:hypothetical protein
MTKDNVPSEPPEYCGSARGPSVKIQHCTTELQIFQEFISHGFLERLCQTTLQYANHEQVVSKSSKRKRAESMSVRDGSFQCTPSSLLSWIAIRLLMGRWSVRSLDDAWHEPDGFSAAYPFAFKNMTRRYFEKLNSLFHCQGSSQGATMQRHRGLPFQKVVCLHVFDSQP